MNSIGNLILHLGGNIRQWIIAGMGEAEDRRDRPSEFSEVGPIPADSLLKQLREQIDQAQATLAKLDAQKMLAERRIQGFELNGWGALFDTIPHFKGHTQEIVSYTRWQLEEAYQFHWKPESEEQGA